jgi:hypothetical protein
MKRKFGHESRWGPEPRMTMLARTPQEYILARKLRCAAARRNSSDHVTVAIDITGELLAA